MLVQEMQIDFNIKVQKVNTNAIDTFLPQEIDWLLNLGQLRLIKHHGVKNLNRQKKGGEDDFARYGDFNALIKRVSLPVTANVEEKYVSSVLPYDFFDYRNGKVKSFYNCNGIASSITERQGYFAVVPFTDSVANPKFLNFSISLVEDLGGSPSLTSIFNVNDYSFDSFVKNEQKFELVNHILEIVNRREDVEVRWETYGDDFASNAFIFIIKDNTFNGINIQYDTRNDNIGVIQDNIETYTDVENVIIKNPVSLRLVETEELYDVLQHPYAKTIYDSPVTTLRGGQIQVYHDNKFIVNAINLDYIRKPRLISLSLNQSCELSVSRHELVVDYAVELATTYTGSDVHKNIVYSNQINE